MTEYEVAQHLLLHSGGLDSHIAWLLQPWRQPVYVRCGGPAERAELVALFALQRHDPRFTPTVLNGPRLIYDFDGHMRYRNALLLTVAAHHHDRAATVAYGSLLGEGTGDKSAAFRRGLNRVWRASEGGPKVVAPLRRWTKAQALRRALQLPGAAPALGLTYSCYDPDGPCGHCQACYRRGVAEYLVGWRQHMPPRPDLTRGVWHAVRSVPASHLPAMALANLDVLRGWAKERNTR